MKQILKVKSIDGQMIKIVKKDGSVPALRMKQFMLPIEPLGSDERIVEKADSIMYHYSTNREQIVHRSYWMVPLENGMLCNPGYSVSREHLVIAEQRKEFKDSFQILKVTGRIGFAMVQSRNYNRAVATGKVAYIIFYDGKIYETDYDGYTHLNAKAIEDFMAMLEIVESSIGNVPASA